MYLSAVPKSFTGCLIVKWVKLNGSEGKKDQYFFELWCLVASWEVGIWVSSTSFRESNTNWPQQPPTEIVLISVKNWIFDDPFHKKGPVLVILIIQPSGSVIFWWNEGVKVIEAMEVAEAVLVIEAAEVLMSGKSLLRTSESSSSWILIYFNVLKKYFFGRFMKYHIEV